MIRASPRNLVEQAAEDFKPPVFKPNTCVRNRLENWLRRFLDLQAGSGWRDMRRELAQVRGRLLDIGCGAQVYRSLLPADVVYLGIDTVDAKARFGYEIPDTIYFEGDDWGVEPGVFDAALCTEVFKHIERPAAFLQNVHRCLRPGGGWC
jgi:SAM-dependent methyltransferase